MDDFVAVRCRGCRRPVGHGKKDYPVVCSASCADMPPASQNEERDSLIEALARALKLTPTEIAIRFDMNRQRVHQILEERHVPKEYG